MVGVGEDVPIRCGCRFYAEIDATLPLVAAAFAKGIAQKVLVGLAVVAIKHREIEVTCWFDGHSYQASKCRSWSRLKGRGVRIITHRSLAKDGKLSFNILEINALVGEFLALEIELVVVARLELEWCAEPSVMRCIAHLEMGDGESQMSAHDLLSNGMAVLQFADGTVITSLL